MWWNADAPRGQTARHALQFLPMGRHVSAIGSRLDMPLAFCAAPRDKKFGQHLPGLPQCDHINCEKAGAVWLCPISSNVP